jgi:hypothetical protein
MKNTDGTGGKQSVPSEDQSFSQVLDDTCGRLWDRKVQYSLRRLGELEDSLDKIEQELNETLQNRQD